MTLWLIMPHAGLTQNPDTEDQPVSPADNSQNGQSTAPDNDTQLSEIPKIEAVATEPANADQNAGNPVFEVRIPDKLAVSPPFMLTNPESASADSTLTDDAETRSMDTANTWPWNVDDSSLGELHSDFVLNYTGEQHPEARDIGVIILERVEVEYGPESMELVVPLNNLATVEELLGNYQTAEEHYLRSIEILETHNGQYHADLIRPLTGLGLTHQSAGRHKQAIQMFQRAQHVTHRKDGVFSLEQLDLLDRITENYVALNEYGEADRAQRLGFKINQHNVNPDSVDVLPALDKLAEWYIQSGQYANALNAYKRSIDLMENEFGKDDLRLLKPLRGIAQAGGGRSRTNSQSTKALERAYKILEQHPDVDPVDRALTLVELADIYTITNKATPAAERYAQAWETLEHNKETEVAQEELFGQPTKLFHPVLFMSEESFIRRRRGEYFVEIEFVVRTDGHVSNVQVIDANAPADARRMVRQMARRARYRPRYENGAAVATEGVTSKQKVFIIDHTDDCTTTGGCRRSVSQFP